MTENQQHPPTQQILSAKEFFEKVPPGRRVSVKDLSSEQRQHHQIIQVFDMPVLELHCDTASCNGIRFFEATANKILTRSRREYHFFAFLCRNCKKTLKTYAVYCILNRDDANGVLFKFGEQPPFGPPTPARVISLIGAEKDYYLKGRRTETQGFGIAAFAYYRRVVENQKNRILDEIIRVSEKIGAPREMLDDLKAAKKETQFSKAVNAVKHGIPQALLLNGHNPLTLLHSALSEGMHEQTDEQCLELATSIRVVLTDLVERLGNALKDHSELNAAVSRLMKANTPKPEEPSAAG